MQTQNPSLTAPRLLPFEIARALESGTAFGVITSHLSQSFRGTTQETLYKAYAESELLTLISQLNSVTEIAAALYAVSNEYTLTKKIRNAFDTRMNTLMQKSIESRDDCEDFDPDYLLLLVPISEYANIFDLLSIKLVGDRMSTMFM